VLVFALLGWVQFGLSTAAAVISAVLPPYKNLSMVSELSLVSCSLSPLLTLVSSGLTKCNITR
jgi:hypothetical protein